MGEGYDVNEGRVQGRFCPVGAGSSSDVAVLILHGSDGSIRRDWAELMAGAGFDALAIRWFGAAGLPEHLVEVPLEIVFEAAEWLRSTSGKRVALFGHSKGAELALLSAVHSPSHIAAVVLWSAGSVAMQGFRVKLMQPAVGQSSWTLKGKPLPFVAYDTVGDKAARERAAIPVEQYSGPVLIFTGSDDRVWPAALMGAQLVERANAHGKEIEHVLFEGAGHMITPELRGKYIPLAGHEDQPLPPNPRIFTGGDPDVDASSADASLARSVGLLRSLS